MKNEIKWKSSNIHEIHLGNVEFLLYMFNSYFTVIMGKSSIIWINYDMICLLQKEPLPEIHHLTPWSIRDKVMESLYSIKTKFIQVWAFSKQ